MIHHSNQFKITSLYELNDSEIKLIKQTCVPENFCYASDNFGRASILELRIADRNCVIRKYNRGGLLSRIIKDIYFSDNRFLNEYNLLNYLIENKFPAAPPVFIVSYKLKFGYNGYIATEQIENQTNMFEIFKNLEISEDIKNNLLEKVKLKIKKLSELKVFHTDFHIKNILVKNDYSDIFVIDFDKGFKYKMDGKKYSAIMVNRFNRSLEKWEIDYKLNYNL